MELSNLLGAGIGGIVAFLLGGFWYSPAAFGKIWMPAAGLTEAQVKSANVGRMLAMTIPLSLIAAIVFAGFLGPETGIGFGTAAGLAAGLFWVSASFGINYTFEQRPLALLLVNGGYHTLQFTLYGFFIGLMNTLL